MQISGQEGRLSESVAARLTSGGPFRTTGGDVNGPEEDSCPKKLVMATDRTKSTHQSQREQKNQGLSDLGGLFAPVVVSRLKVRPHFF